MKIDADGKHHYRERGFHKNNVYYDSDIAGLPKFAKITPKYSAPT